MYTFKLQESQKNYDVVMVRVLFAITATASFLMIGTKGLYMLFVGLAAAIASYYINFIRQKIKIDWLLCIAVIILTAVTFQLLFLLIIALHFALKKWVLKSYIIQVHEQGVHISRTLKETSTEWNKIEFVVLKDSLLTIQYKAAGYIQEPVELPKDCSEAFFNQFCNEQLSKSNNS